MALKILDLTDLRDNLTEDDFLRLVKKANDNIEYVAAVCLPRKWAVKAKPLLHSSVNVASVYNFPNGDELVENVCLQIQDDYTYIDEFDVVIPLEQPNFSETASFIRQVRRATEGRILKCILETAIQTMRDIDILTQICMERGVDFVKTSTGRREGATIRDVSIILNRLYVNRYEQTGIKISGGIKTYNDFNDFVNIAELFKVPLKTDTLRIGASSVLDEILDYEWQLREGLPSEGIM